MSIITITAQFPRRRLSEGSQASFSASVYSDAYVASAPTTAKYRIDCPESGETLTDWTSLTAASSMTISLNGSTQTLRDQGLSEERRRLTVMTDSGLSTQNVKTYDWYVSNAVGIS